MKVALRVALPVFSRVARPWKRQRNVQSTAPSAALSAPLPRRVAPARVALVHVALAHVALALSAVALTTAGHAQDVPRQLTVDPAGPFMVTSVLDGDTVALADGRRVRLLNIQALEIDRDDPRATDPLAVAARDALAEMVAGAPVTLAYGENRRDRFGRVLAHVFLADGTWVQQALLDAGLVHVYSFADNRALVPELLARERGARAAGAGIWRTRAATAHTRAADEIGSYAWVEGRVSEVAIVRGRGFLNFGADFRTDFTISVPPGKLPSFGSLADYRGRHVRVRGWLQSRNGPMIEVTHPEQREVLSP